MLPSQVFSRGSARGYALLLALCAAVSLTFFGFTVSVMNQGLRTQVQHTNEQQVSFQVAYSGFQRVLARIYLKPWEERFFKSAPVAENGLSYLGARYDLYVENAPGAPNQADIYARVTVVKTPRVYVWRVEHIPDLLDPAQLKTLLFSEIDAKNFPAGGTSYGSKITQLLTDRKNKRPQAEQMIQTLTTLTDIRDIAQVLGARPPALPPVFRLGLPPPPTGLPNLYGTLPAFNPGGLTSPPGFPGSTGEPTAPTTQTDSLLAQNPAPPPPPPPGDPMAPTPDEQVLIGSLPGAADPSLPGFGAPASGSAGTGSRFCPTCNRTFDTVELFQAHFEICSKCKAKRCPQSPPCPCSDIASSPPAGGPTCDVFVRKASSTRPPTMPICLVWESCNDVDGATIRLPARTPGPATSVVKPTARRLPNANVPRPLPG